MAKTDKKTKVAVIKSTSKEHNVEAKKGDAGQKSFSKFDNKNTSKPSGVGMYEAKEGGRPWTLSVALPASIVANAQSHELRSYLVAQIARCLTIYGVDEVVVYEDDNTLPQSKDNPGCSQSLCFFVNNLQYLETPQYLRRILFPMHPDLKYAGLQNPLDAPHHMRKGEKIAYREGVVLQTLHEPKHRARPRPEGEGCYICCGLDEPVWIEDHALEAKTRVTVKLREGDWTNGDLVPPSEPREELGVYWGYQTRIARSLHHVFSECPHNDEENEGKNLHSPSGYDFVLGTSERGVELERELLENSEKLVGDKKHKKKLKADHMLIIFGGVGGLEDVMRNDVYVSRDPKTEGAQQGKLTKTMGNPRKLCHHYVNICTHQTSRTIRAEEALMIALAKFEKFLER